VLRFLSVVLLALLVLCGCKRAAPEEALRRNIAQMQEAVSERDAGALSDGIAPDFIGPNGMGREDAGRLARVVFLRNKHVGVTLGPLDVAMGGGGLLPDNGQVYDVTTTWRQDGDAWVLLSAEWTPKL
jgi:hypothetical protein